MQTSARRFLAAAGAIAAHAVVFALVSSLPPPPAPTKAAVREVVEVEVVELAPVEAAAASEPASPAPAPRPPARARRAAAQRIAPQAAPPPAPVPSSPPELAAPEPSAVAVPVAPSRDPEEAGVAEGTPGGAAIGSTTGSGRGAGSTAGEGAGGLGSWRSGGGSPGDEALALVQARLSAAAAGCYPRAAARFRAEGVAKVRFCVEAGGEASARSLLESSGHALLDDAAVGCVLDRASPLPELARCLTVPIQFRVAR